MVSGLPAEIGRLMALAHLTIESGAFSNWKSVYECTTLKTCSLIRKAAGTLADGIVVLTQLETILIRAKGVTLLPADHGEDPDVSLDDRHFPPLDCARSFRRCANNRRRGE